MPLEASVACKADRLLSRTLEYLSQVYSLRESHPELSRVAAEAMDRLRRGVLEELP